MSRESSPAFQFYPRDFLADRNVMAMSLAEKGAYIILLCHCWLDGYIPKDPEQLRRIVGFNGRRCWNSIKTLCSCFIEDNDGHLIHPRIERERQKQASFRARGKKGGQASAKLRASKLQASVNPSSSSSSSSSISSTNNKLIPAPVFVPPAKPPQANGNGHARQDDQAKRAAKFLERFSSLHEELRNGAHYHGKPSVDFQTALDLVTTWSDDARLEKLVRVFMKTNDKWVSSRPRSVGVFASRASWCDDRLREAEKARAI